MRDVVKLSQGIKYTIRTYPTLNTLHIMANENNNNKYRVILHYFLVPCRSRVAAVSTSLIRHKHSSEMSEALLILDIILIAHCRDNRAESARATCTPRWPQSDWTAGLESKGPVTWHNTLFIQPLPLLSIIKSRYYGLARASTVNGEMASRDYGAIVKLNMPTWQQLVIILEKQNKLQQEMGWKIYIITVK